MTDLVHRSAAARLLAAGEAEERRGQREAARADFERALYAVRAEDAPDAAAEIARCVARTYFDDGRFDAMEDTLALCEAIAELNGCRRVLAFAQLLRAGASHVRGELDEALASYEEARTRAEAADAADVTALVQSNVAVIHSVRGEHERALEAYQESLAIFTALDRPVYAAQCLNNLARLYHDMGELDLAEQRFAEAADLCIRTHNVTDYLLIQANRAEVWIRRGNLARAEALCLAALAETDRAGDSRSLGDLHKHLGVIARERGRAAEGAERARLMRQAEEHLDRADRVAQRREDLLLAAETAKERAVVAEAEGRSQQTLRHLNRAYRLFTQLQATRELMNVEGHMGRLEEMFLHITSQWADSIEAKDLYTRGHCERVAAYACALARAVGAYDEKTLLWFRMGALLHDVGKIAIPAEVLNKAGGLTPSERLLMESHPDSGVELLHDIEFAWDIRPMVRFHHERWLGGGYPTGIQGEHIPLSARILAIADVFDALTSHRPYRPGYSPEQAMEVMRMSMHGHFDPSLFTAWEHIFEGAYREANALALAG